MAPQVTSVALASEITGINERTIRRMCADGRIPGATLIGKTWALPYQWAAQQEDTWKPHDGYVPLVEAAFRIGITREATRQLCERGRLKGVKRMVDKRGHWMIDEADMKRYIKKRNGYVWEKED
jgi:predicted site-specific integrase-resolvase